MTDRDAMLCRLVEAVERLAGTEVAGRRSARAESRLALGAATVLPYRQAAEMLPIKDADARNWLAERGLVRNLLGRQVVIWGDVLRALRDDGASTPATCSPRPKLGRVNLDAINR